MGSYNLFDFGKREHTVKERNAQRSAAELAVQLTKAKVAESVQNSFFQLERSRQLSELTHRLARKSPIRELTILTMMLGLCSQKQESRSRCSRLTCNIPGSCAT